MEPETRNITTRIDAPPGRVYEFARDPYNLPRWAPSFFLEVERVDNDWVVHSPLGRALIEFAPLNEEGVLDHRLRLDSGEVLVNHMRVVPSGEGSEIGFVLSRREGMSDAQFDADAALVAADFARLRTMVEQGVADAMRALPPEEPGERQGSEQADGSGDAAAEGDPALHRDP
ncbi:MAG: SRPBCC family protein [Burkholderiaceae bacterium]